MLPISTVSPSTHISHTPETWFLPITIITNELHITKFNRYFSVIGIHYLISQSLQHLGQLYSSSLNFLTLHSPVILLPAGMFSSTCPLNVGITSISVLDTLIISLLTFFLGNFTHTQWFDYVLLYQPLLCEWITDVSILVRTSHLRPSYPTAWLWQTWRNVAQDSTLFKKLSSSGKECPKLTTFDVALSGSILGFKIKFYSPWGGPKTMMMEKGSGAKV